MIKLSGVSETLLVPLYMKALETRRSDGIIRDPRAVEIVENLDYDFSKFDGAWKSQIGFSVRTEILDEVVMSFLKRFPNALIVNLGAGLCTRFGRMDNSALTWLELDLPEVAELWHKFNDETGRHKFLAYSATDFRWMDKVKQIKQEGQKVLFIAEGLFHYFMERDVKQVIIAIKNNFPGSEMLAEVIGPLFVSNARSHDTLSKLGVRFSWGIKNLSDIEKWDGGIKLIDEWNLIDRHSRRWKWMNIIKLPFLKKHFGKIGHLRFE